MNPPPNTIIELSNGMYFFASTLVSFDFSIFYVVYK